MDTRGGAVLYCISPRCSSTYRSRVAAELTNGGPSGRSRSPNQCPYQFFPCLVECISYSYWQCYCETGDVFKVVLHIHGRGLFSVKGIDKRLGQRLLIIGGLITKLNGCGCE
jgi:hypothetical protein